MKNVVIAILAVLVLGMGGFLVYDKVIVKNEKTQDEETEKNLGESSENNNGKNDYKIFSENLKNKISNIYNETNDGEISSWYEKYSIDLDKNRTIYITYHDENLNKKFGKYKLADNVLSYYIVQTGQGGDNTLYFINEDGTVGSANIDYPGYDNDNQISVKKDIGYKNIVTIIEGGFGISTSGIREPIFIDINGNMYSTNLH